MSVKTAVVGSLIVLVCGVLETAAQAGPYSWGDGGTGWTSWVVGQGEITASQSAGLSSSSSSSSTPAATDTSAPQTLQTPTFTPLSLTSSSASPAPSTLSASTVDAFINFGTGPYPDAGTITTGNAQPWFDSPQVASLFGGTPNSQQQSAFESTVMQRVEQTFQLSGVPVTLTDNPSVPAAHTLSVVGDTTSNTLSNAIGMTYVGGDGFHFIDNSAGMAQSVDQLEWIVAHNLAHELMLAFGVPEINDHTGNYIDAPVANWAMMLNPNATFSAGAVKDLLAQNFLLNNSNSTSGQGPQILAPQSISPATVPEPSTVALWALSAVGIVLSRRLRSRRAA